MPELYGRAALTSGAYPLLASVSVQLCSTLHEPRWAPKTPPMLPCCVETISSMGRRATQGVRLMKLGEDEALVAVERLVDEDAGEGNA